MSTRALVDHDADALVIGGSVAGLQIALTLGRARRRVIVFDDGRPRNASAQYLNNFLGRDGISPARFISDIRDLLEPYDVEFVDERAVSATANNSSGIAVADGESVRTWRGRALVIATGLVDELPQVPGLQPLWGRQVVACPHCHGWEVREEPLGLVGRPDSLDRSVERALLVSRWSSDVIFFTEEAALSEDHCLRLTALGIQVESTRISSVEKRGADDVTVTLANGRTIDRRRLFAVVRQRHQSDLAWQLGCEPVIPGDTTSAIQTDAAGRSSIVNVWVAGTAAVPALLAVGAAGHASSVAIAIHDDLTRRDGSESPSERNIQID